MPAEERRIALERAVRTELLVAVEPAVSVAATFIRARLGPSVAAVLFYGPSLRHWDGGAGILDYYVIVDHYRALQGRRWPSLVNRLLPPNLFYVELKSAGAARSRTDGNQRIIRIKYATLALDHFERQVTPQSFNPLIWARFAQPSRLVWSRDERTTARIIKAIGSAMVTAVGEGAALVLGTFEIGDLWCRLFTETQRVELGASGLNKGREIYAGAREHYQTLTPLILACCGSKASDGERYTRPDTVLGRKEAQSRWSKRRWQRKMLKVPYAIKATFGFEGGLDYLAWKFNTAADGAAGGLSESGWGGRSAVARPLKITPWQRRHPVLGALTLHWRLRHRGGFRHPALY